MTREPATSRVLTWLAEAEPGALAISDWVVTEFSAALSIKLRTGAITGSERAAALAMMARMNRDNLLTMPVSSGCFRTAARFADQYGLGIRAGDALHLAICAESGTTLCTLDQRLGAAGSALGVPTLLV